MARPAAGTVLKPEGEGQSLQLAQWSGSVGQWLFRGCSISILDGAKGKSSCRQSSVQVEYNTWQTLKETGALPGVAGYAHAQGPWNRSRAQTLCRAEVGLQQRPMAVAHSASGDRGRCWQRCTPVHRVTYNFLHPVGGQEPL